MKIHHNNAYKHEQQNNEQPQHNTGGMRGLKLTVLHPSTSIILANIFLQKLHLKRKCTHCCAFFHWKDNLQNLNLCTFALVIQSCRKLSPAKQYQQKKAYKPSLFTMIFTTVKCSFETQAEIILNATVQSV